MIASLSDVVRVTGGNADRGLASGRHRSAGKPATAAGALGLADCGGRATWGLGQNPGRNTNRHLRAWTEPLVASLSYIWAGHLSEGRTMRNFYVGRDGRAEGGVCAQIGLVVGDRRRGVG